MVSYTVCFEEFLIMKLQTCLSIFGLLLSIVCLPTVLAQETGDDTPITHTLYVQGGAYIHFDDDDDYAGNRLFVSAELIRSDQWLYGLGLFNNSFDQFSQYLYGGYQFEFDDSFKNFHAKVTAGIIHGYKDEFQDKLSYNSSGYAPAIIPSLGWKKDKLGVDVILLGSAGLLFTVGYDFLEF